MKPHGFIRVVKKWHSMHVDPVLRCLDDPEGLNSGYLRNDAILEFVSWLTV
jgi:hypothetical protein